MTEPDPTPPGSEVTGDPQRAHVVVFWLRTAWLLLLTAAGFAGVGAGWLPDLELLSIALATASLPLVVWWAYRVAGV